LRQLAETTAARARISHTDAYSPAMLYFRAGENDLALGWMESLRRPRSGFAGSRWYELRDYPRFQDLLRRIDLPLS